MLSSERCRQIFLVVAIFVMPLTAFAGSAPLMPVEIHLDAEVKVSGDQVVLGDVATIYAKSLADFKSLSGLVISRIPDDRQEVNLPSSYLEARIRAALPEGMTFALHAPAQINFKLQRLGVSEVEVASEISRLAKANAKVPLNAEIEVVPISGMDQLKGVSLAGIRIEPSGEMEKWKGDMVFRVARTGTNPAAPTWLRARVRWFQRAWMAARAMNFSEQLNAASFTEGRIETTNLREEPVGGTSEELAAVLKASKLKRGLASNTALMPSLLERRPDAGPGSLLHVIFVSEAGVRVSAEGALVAPGSIGGDVKARLKTSKKIVTGKLVSQGVVEVTL